MSNPLSPVPRYSVVVPVGRRFDDVPALVAAYAETFESTRVDYEMIVVLDGPKEGMLEPLMGLAAGNGRLRIIELARSFGESAALMAGFDSARGDLLITLPAYYQVDVPEIPKIIAALDREDDMLIAVRSPRAGGVFEKVRRAAFHGLLRAISGMRYRDLGCTVRLVRRGVFAEISLYGDQDRFFPALAARRGFRVREIELAQSRKDRFRGRYRVREYLHRVLDVLTVFFLVRFTKKPLRFFGSIGALAAGTGALAMLVLVVQRLFLEIPLADRPALLLASLLIVLGLQTAALGLIGELIIFTHASQMKEYAIRRVIGGPDARAVAREAERASASADS
jgi:glycosyltransferase involved in cell wall biosynthesis